MNKHAISVVIATSLGAFIGSMVALNLPGYWWLVGVVVGGLVGYLAYDFKRVLAALPIAWQQTRAALTWRPHWHLGEETINFLKKNLWIYLAAITSTALTASALAAISILLLSWLDGPVNQQGAIEVVQVIAIMTGFLTVLGITPCPIESDHSKVSLTKSIFALKYLNFPMVAVYWPLFGLYYALWFLFILLYTAWLIVTATPLLVKRLFILIHSDMRLLCGTDAAIGTVIGYMIGNPLVGLVIGGLVGYINFELISKRWLKLSPVPNGQ